MDWFLASAIVEKPNEEIKKEFNKVVNEISSAKQRLYHKKSMKIIPDNGITRKISRDVNYANRVDALLKLENLHVQRNVCNQLIEIACLRSMELENEIKRIELKYIEPEYVNYLFAHFPKRSYEIQGQEITTYKGDIQWNGKFFIAVGILLGSSLFF